MNSEVKVIELSGRLDVTSAAQFRRDVNDVLVSKPKYLLVDLKAVNFMDSSGLGALVSALKTIRSVDGELALCSLSEQVQMLFELTSMNKIFNIYPSHADFDQEINAKK